MEELSFTKMIKVRAGSFSATLCAQGNLFVWGEGTFGKFYSPRRVKSAKKLEIADFQIARSGIAALITQAGTVYSWGVNDLGQLGHGD